jgi:hypothetical protein
MAKATFSGKDFRELISNVTKLPSLGAFLGSELINLEVKEGVCKASSFSVIVSVSQIEAKGTMPLFNISERLLIPYSAACEGVKWVSAEIIEDEKKGTKEILIRNSRGPKINYPLQTGKNFDIPIPEDIAPLEITEALAKKIAYLSDIAFSDSSMPQLNCVYLTPKTVTAVNQKCVALLKVDTKLKQNVAVPIPISKVISSGNQLYSAPKRTIIKNGSASYAMSSPVQAQQNFPFKTVLEYYKAPKTPVLTVSGEAFSDLITLCNSCLSTVSRIDVPLTFTANSDGTLVLNAENGMAKFENAIKTKAVEQEVELSIPLDEIVRALPFLTAQETLSLKLGPNSETYITMPDGMLMYPAFTNTKKKKKK